MAGATTAPTKLTTIDVAKVSGATLGAKLSAAFAALPAAGGVLDCRRLKGAQSSGGVTVSVTKPVEVLLGAGTVAVSVGPLIDILAGGAGTVVRGEGARVTILQPAAGITPLRGVGTKEIEFSNLSVQYAAGNAANVAIHLLEAAGPTPLVGAIIKDCYLLGVGQLGVAVKLGRANRVSILDCTVEGFGLKPIDVVDNGVNSAHQFTMQGCTFTNNALVIPHNWYQVGVFGEDKVADIPGPNMPILGGWYLYQINRPTYEVVEPIEALEAALFVKNTSPGGNVMGAFIGVVYIDAGASSVLSVTGTVGAVEHHGASVCEFARGVEATVASKSAGPISNAECIHAHVDIDVGGSAHITNLYGFHMYASQDIGFGGAVIDNWFAVFVDDPSIAGPGLIVPTNAWCFYSVAGADFYVGATSDVSAFSITGDTGQTWIGAAIDGGSTSKLTVAQTLTQSTGGLIMARFAMTHNPGANSTATVEGIDSTVTVPNANTKTIGTVSGIVGAVQHDGSGAATELIGVQGLAVVGIDAVAAALEGVAGIVRNHGSGAITLAAALHAGTPVNDGGGSIITYCGLLVDAPGSVGTTAYAIFVAGGLVEFDHVFTATVGQLEAARLFLSVNPTANSAAVPAALDVEAQTDPANTRTHAQLIGLEVFATHYGSGAMTLLSGMTAQAILASGGATVAQADAISVRVENESANNITLAIGVHIRAPVNGGAGTIPQFFGIYVENPTAGVVNYAIITDGGNVLFNAGQTVGGNLYLLGSGDANLIASDVANDLIGIGVAAPAAKLHVNASALGNEVLRLTTPATNDDPNWYSKQNRIVTGNGTKTTLHTEAIPNNKMLAVHAIVSWFRTDATPTGNNGHAYLIAAFKNDGGTPGQIGATTTVISVGTGTITIELVGGGVPDAIITVTGAGGATITWHVTAWFSTVGS